MEHYLFDVCLGLKEISKDYCKNIIGILKYRAESFDFIAKERKIKDANADMIKTLIMSREDDEMMKIFKKLSKHVPEIMSSQLLKMLKDDIDSSEIIIFILKYIDIVEVEKLP